MLLVTHTPKLGIVAGVSPQAKSLYFGVFLVQTSMHLSNRIDHLNRSLSGFLFTLHMQLPCSGPYKHGVDEVDYDSYACLWVTHAIASR